MASKRFSTLLIARVLLLTASIGAMCWLSLHYQLLFIPVFFILVIAGQVWELIWFVNKSNRELKKFLEALRFGDYSINFSSPDLGNSFKELYQSFNQLIDALRESKIEKQTQTELLKLALENISLGIIILDRHKGIVLLNSAAKDILEIPQFQSWDIMEKKKSDFTSQLGNLDFEGRRLINIKTNGETRECYLDLIQISLLGQAYKLISFSDLKKEIEQKEIEAWHKLIRILAHEVMNSITPVTSLSETIKEMLLDEKGQPAKAESLDASKIDDMILGLNTIIRRSKGMLNFVDDYRKLTRLPAPNFEIIGVKELLQEVSKLMSTEAADNQVSLNISMPNNRIAIRADRKMIEQSLINLISNALHALQETEHGKITLAAALSESNLIISVIDNGPGISDDILPSIFIPFFSTRNNGTGIGLTLTKNIMRLHRGSINVSSKPNEGARFELVFNL